MSTTPPAIDMWAPVVPTRDTMAYMRDHFPEAQLGYLRVFFKQAPRPDTFPRLADALATDDDAILAAMDAANVARVLITGLDEKRSAGTTTVSNEVIAAVAERHPERFIPFAGADVFRGTDALRDLEYWVTRRSFKGLSLRPFMIGLPADDRRYYPFYARCVELGIPVSMHASHNWTTERPSDLGHPRHFDAVACDFPDLKLILSHGGYPWVLEACLLAWKHPNVYLELAAHRPRYFTVPGAGWEPLLLYGQTTIQDKVLYGSGAFLLGRSLPDLLGEFRSLPIKPAVMEKWLYQNAAALLGLEADARIQRRR
jgi:predicted TIM-barrel fold metal-dependent hydrolase